jgi:hypothetical protein
LTPVVAATHHRWFRLFRVGRSATDGLQQLAENGGVPVLVAELEANRKVGDVAVVGSAPIGPGASATAAITAGRWKNRISLAGMLICTNDGFAGVSSMRLPHRTGQTRTVYARAYDAGTEINTEAYADLVPPCGNLGGTGVSDPALAQNGVVRPHRGIIGGADLDPEVHGWHGRVVKVTITRTG